MHIDNFFNYFWIWIYKLCFIQYFYLSFWYWKIGKNLVKFNKSSQISIWKTKKIPKISQFLCQNMVKFCPKKEH